MDFRMRFKKDQDVDSGVFEYHVSFNPPVDNVRDKKAIIRQQEHVLGRKLETNRISGYYSKNWKKWKTAHFDRTSVLLEPGILHLTLGKNLH